MIKNTYKKILGILFFSLIIITQNSSLINAVDKSEDKEDLITLKQVISLVDKTALKIQENTPKTLESINKAEEPYKDKDNPTLYVFVYDSNVNIVAHAANPALVGKNYKGKPDVKGNNFRDKIVEKALTKGSGWVDYYYKKPDGDEIFHKAAYSKLVKGIDNKQYIVCAGMYFKNFENQ